MPNSSWLSARRRALPAFLAGCIVAASAGCAAGSPADTTGVDDGRPVVLTTFTVLADLASNVAGEHVRVESLTSAGAEIHGYEPTPSDLRRASDADLILDNGLGLEAWFEQFVAELDVPHVVVSEHVDPVPIDAGVEGSPANPHAWMSPINAISYVDVIERALAQLDPAHADDFAANARAYREQLEAVQGDLERRLSAVPAERRALVTCEGAFSYLARDAGLVERYLWPVNAEQQSTPQLIADVIDFVRDNDIPAVFCESTVSDATMRQVAAETGARLLGPLYVDSLSAPDGPVPTYLELLRHDVELIVEGLAGDSTSRAG